MSSADIFRTGCCWPAFGCCVPTALGPVPKAASAFVDATADPDAWGGPPPPPPRSALLSSAGTPPATVTFGFVSLAITAQPKIFYRRWPTEARRGGPTMREEQFSPAGLRWRVSAMSALAVGGKPRYATETCRLFLHTHRNPRTKCGGVMKQRLPRLDHPPGLARLRMVALPTRASQGPDRPSGAPSSLQRSAQRPSEALR